MEHHEPKSFSLGGSKPVRRKTAYRLLSAGKIKAFRLGHSYRIPKISVIEYLTHGMEQTDTASDEEEKSLE